MPCGEQRVHPRGQDVADVVSGHDTAATAEGLLGEGRREDAPRIGGRAWELLGLYGEEGEEGGIVPYTEDAAADSGQGEEHEG